MESYKVKKSIHQYSLVDLLEILLNQSHPEYNKAKKEFDSRTPSIKELEMAKKGLKVRLEVRNKPLSFFDKVNCFIIPLTTRNSLFKSHIGKIENKFKKDLKEFEYYGENRRVKELKKWQNYALITYFVILPLLGCLYFLYICNFTVTK